MKPKYRVFYFVRFSTMLSRYQFAGPLLTKDRDPFLQEKYLIYVFLFWKCSDGLF